MKTPSIRAFLAAMVLCAVCQRSLADSTYTYVLLPGSTITPTFGANPTGPTEALSGTFEWRAPIESGGLWIFDAASLAFSSDSFALTLDDPPTDNEATSVFKSTPTSYFAENVFATGLLFSQGYISSHTVGSYLGPASLPTFVSYTDVKLVPNGGGVFAAKMNFTAELVPEPSSIVLGAFGTVFLALAVARRSRRCAGGRARLAEAAVAAARQGSPMRLTAVVLAVLLCARVASASTLTYELQPGSTIRPYFGASPTGPAEPLSGSFQWTLSVDGGSVWGFNAVDINFSSPSFTIGLNSTPANDTISSVAKTVSWTSFDEVGDFTGLAISSGYISTSYPGGTYTGPSTAPNTLSYSDLTISPIGGGHFAAHLSFTATLVPEPTTLTLGTFGALLLPCWVVRHRRKCAKNAVNGLHG